MYHDLGGVHFMGRGPLKSRADTSDTADIHQKLILKKEEAIYSNADAMACG